MTKPFTLLIHGLHMHGLYMRPLAKKLAKSGFTTHAISYPSLSQSIAHHSRLIHDYLTRHHDNTPINLVGHSLGGLVVRHFLATYGNHWQIHRCVSLGTPHKGSICANYAHRFLSPLVHHAYPNALDGTCPLPPNVEFGVIAGTRPIGLGVAFLSYHNHRHRLPKQQRIHDGTVYLSETILANATDYLTLPVSHTGLLTDHTVAMQVVHFLEHGNFKHQ